MAGFPAKLRAKLQTKPHTFISRKNPFLFRIRDAKNVEELAWRILDAFLSSSEETIFGDVLEDLAVIVCRHARGGQKSGIEHIDLEYSDPSGARMLIQVKSSVHWGNSSQHKALREAFARAMTILRQGNRNLHVRCIEGCCYGKSEIKDRGTHERIVGYEFWKEISGWEGTASAILKLVGEYAENGLQDAREHAHGVVVNYLHEMEVATDTGLAWDKLLHIIMTGAPRGKRGSR